MEGRDLWSSSLFSLHSQAHTKAYKKCNKKVPKAGTSTPIKSKANNSQFQNKKAKMLHTTVKFEIEYYKQNLKKVIFNL